jgi:hypothetical protein
MSGPFGRRKPILDWNRTPDLKQVSVRANIGSVIEDGRDRVVFDYEQGALSKEDRDCVRCRGTGRLLVVTSVRSLEISCTACRGTGEGEKDRMAMLQRELGTAGGVMQINIDDFKGPLK